MSDQRPRDSVATFQGLPEHRRHGYDLVQGHMADQLVEYAHPDCLVVTVLREPVDRIISHYYYVKGQPTHYLHQELMRRRMTLEEYASSDLSTELRNWYTCHFSGRSLQDVESNPGDAVARAADRLTARYDVVGLLDALPLFVEQLRDRAGLTYEYVDKRMNVSSNRPGKDSIPESVMAGIREVNHLDVELYARIKAALDDGEGAPGDYRRLLPSDKSLGRPDLARQ